MTKSKKTQHETIVMSLEVHRYPAKTMFLRTEVASGAVGGYEFEFSTNISGEPIVRIGNGNWYLLNIIDFVMKAAETEGIPADLETE